MAAELMENSFIKHGESGAEITDWGSFFAVRG